jgi:serine O-acetyltransferase
MDPKSVFLLLLQVQVIHVSCFTTQNQQRQVGIPETPFEHQRQSISIPQLIATTISTQQLQQQQCRRRLSFHAASIAGESAEDSDDDKENESSRRASTYDLGVGINLPVGSSANNDSVNDESSDIAAQSKSDNDKEDIHWNVPDHPNSNSKATNERLAKSIANAYSVSSSNNSEDVNSQPRRVSRMVARTEKSSKLRGAIWHEEHYSVDDQREEETTPPPSNSLSSSSSISNATGTFERSNVPSLPTKGEDQDGPIKRPELFYPNIDLSIPPPIYDPETSKDIVWDLMRWEAYQEAQREPLLVSFLYSSILNHKSLESSLAFLLANKLSSAAMISTQVQSLILDALYKDRSIGRAIRADIMVSQQMMFHR